jgi:hypothetical protein
MSTSGEPGEHEITITTTPEQAAEFLKRMADESDTLRAEFNENPRAVLQQFGVTVSEELIPPDVTAPDAQLVKDALATFARGDDPAEITFWGWLPTFRTFRTFKVMTWGGPRAPPSPAERMIRP